MLVESIACFRSKPVRLPFVSFTFQQKPLTAIVVVIVFSIVCVVYAVLLYCFGRGVLL